MEVRRLSCRFAALAELKQLKPGTMATRIPIITQQEKRQSHRDADRSTAYEIPWTLMNIDI